MKNEREIAAPEESREVRKSFWEKKVNENVAAWALLITVVASGSLVCYAASQPAQKPDIKTGEPLKKYPPLRIVNCEDRPQESILFLPGMQSGDTLTLEDDARFTFAPNGLIPVLIMGANTSYRVSDDDIVMNTEDVVYTATLASDTAVQIEASCK